ncbi:adenosine receptor A2a [Nematostella vectensis]|uniref:adenosine receptor A2a n=1 Tax=Nematostella vectensis TaxID=45351 RepID=UPI0020777582|nr:adenosine receptor A2a [Nematostella vectensis]
MTYAFDLRLTYFICILLNGVLAPITTLANLILVTLIWRNNHLQSPSNLLVGALALSDLGVGCFVQPLYIAYKVAEMQRLEAYCLLAEVFNLIATELTCVSFLIMTALSVDRWLAITLHLRYSTIVTRKLVLVVVIVCWVISLVLPVGWWWNFDIYNTGISVIIGLCSLCTLVLYYKIYRVVRRHQTAIAEAQTAVSREVNVTAFRRRYISMIYLYSLFLLCYLPSAWISIANLTLGTPTFLTYKTTQYGLTLAFMNSSINPLLLTWKIVEVRQAFRQRLARLCGTQEQSS